ncbi:hypothetical protein ACJA88_013632 [Fusarium oxysporum]
MALYYWFKDGPQQSSRDWVFTLGGYHPAYNAPAQYPLPPRLQLAWSLGPLSITGSAYFAITPSTAIAGVSLHAILDIGVLHAFLDAWVGSLINYQPFMFTASGGINVGVLDIGTGTGIWAIDFADQYPNAQVIGTDLSPIQPDWVPPNVRFELEDATSNWTWSNDSFDFVHMRYLIGAITDWGALFKEAFRCCKPGGFVESVEVNPTFLSDDETAGDVMAVQTWNKLFREASKALGRSFCEIEGDVELLAASGFVDLQVTDFKVPVGGWAKDSKLRQVGQFLRATIENDLEGYTLMAWQQILGWPRDEYELFLMDMRKALRDKKVHSYIRVRFINARKPWDAR